MKSLVTFRIFTTNDKDKNDKGNGKYFVLLAYKTIMNDEIGHLFLSCFKVKIGLLNR
jgi:hypothetical protein